MDIAIGDLLTIEGKKYITLEKTTYENNEYLFVNEVTNDEEDVTEDFYILKVVDDKVRIIVEEELKNVLIPKFQQLLEKDIKELLEEE
ncbi:MAG: hypothetical protein IJ509_01190 [Bacilli bacterium]|nr:hypothetical protein [Bacilli bacterium]